MATAHASKSRTAGWRAVLETWFGDTIWRPIGPDASLTERARRRLSRYLYLIVRRVLDDDVLSAAAALSYHVLLSLVPLLAVAFSLSKGFGFKHGALHGLLENLAVGQKDLVDQVIAYVDRTNVGALGTVGLLFLIYTAISLLGRIEAAFNAIWGVTRSRSFVRKFADYLSVMLIFPLLMMSATTMTASLSSNSLVARLLEHAYVAPLLKLIPLAIIWGAFTFIYVFLPNTRVRIRAGMAAGLVAALVWQIAQWAYIGFQVGVSKYNAIYGTFAALPIFLVWLNISWAIVLLGCEVAFVVQHEQHYHPPRSGARRPSLAVQERTALRFVATCWQRFRAGESPPVEGDLAAEVDLPRGESAEIVERLVRSGLLTRARTPEDGLLPGRDLTGMTAAQVLLRFRHQDEAADEEDGAGSDALERDVAALHAQLEAALHDAGDAPLESLSSP